LRQHRRYIGIEWPLEREMSFYPVAIRLLKQTLKEGLEGVRMESAMIRTTWLNCMWFTTVISLDHYILSVLSPSLFYSKTHTFSYYRWYHLGNSNSTT
jgi:hypothetical protein